MVKGRTDDGLKTEHDYTTVFYDHLVSLTAQVS